MLLRVAVVAIAVSIASSARAEGNLGFVNLADDPAAGSAAIDQIRPWVSRRGVRVLGAGVSRTALEAPPSPPPRPQLGELERLRERAFDAYAGFDHKAALAEIAAALEVAAAQPPGPEVAGAIVGLAVLAGQIELGRRDRPSAMSWFRLAGALGGGAELDPGIYSPQVNAVYKKALAATPKTGTLEVSGDGVSIAVDGAEIAARAELPAGRHWLVLRRTGYRPSQRLVEIQAGGVTEVDAELAPLEGPALIGALRGAAREATEPGLLASLASAAGVTELLLIRGAAGALEAARFRDGQLSRWVKADETGLGSLFPKPANLRVDDPGGGDGVDLGLRDGLERSTTPWYRTTWGIVGISAGVAVVAAAVGGAVLYSRRDKELALGFCGVGTRCPE